MSTSTEWIPVDYERAYVALSRRVSAVHAYSQTGCHTLAHDEIAKAMEIIEQVEQTFFVVNILPKEFG